VSYCFQEGANSKMGLILRELVSLWYRDSLAGAAELHETLGMIDGRWEAVTTL